MSGSARDCLVADIGGTHARFALACAGPDGRPLLEAVARMRVADHPGFGSALAAYAASLRRPLPRRAAMAVAGPVGGEPIRLTNSPWVLQPARMADELGFDTITLLNDLEAVAHAVDVLGPDGFRHLAGPNAGLPETGAISVISPGTGLGAALLVRPPAGPALVLPTEGGHMAFAPQDGLDDRILAGLRARFGRVSVERVVAGPGLASIRAALAAIEGAAPPPMDDAALWAEALAGTDRLARAALDRWCLALGSVAGDLALAHGSAAVVLAGGIVPRLGDMLSRSGFHARFCAKGRFAARMAAFPILAIAHAEPGLLGAAAVGLGAAGGAGLGGSKENSRHGPSGSARGGATGRTRDDD